MAASRRQCILYPTQFPRFFTGPTGLYLIYIYHKTKEGTLASLLVFHFEGDHLAIAIDDQSHGNIDFSINLPLPSTINQPKITFYHGNAEMLRAGISVLLISITQKLNPPIVVNVNRAHVILAEMHSFTIFANLVIGVLLLVFSVVMPWAPKLAWMAKRLLCVGMWLVKATIGFGASLVLLVSSSSWLVLYLVFLTIQFLY